MVVTVTDNLAGRRRLRILVADDEAAIRSMLMEILTELGHEVVVVTNGEEALKCLATEQVQLVLTDLDMPGATGWDVIDGAKARDPQLPVLLVTGLGHKLSGGEGRHRPDAVVPKPFTFLGLEEAIAACFRKRREVGDVPSARA